MTELEKMGYAKSYIDKLANGINPLDNSPLKEDDIVNNIHLSRCFFYVSDVLRQVIENGGVNKSLKVKKVPFSITPEELANFEYSDSPLLISEIAKRINALSTAENMKSLNTTNITKWLVSIDILKEEIGADGKKRKIPTESGEQLGLHKETRVYHNNSYNITVYDRSAQEFIIDNMDAILAYK